MSGTYMIAALAGCLITLAAPALPSLLWCIAAPGLAYVAWRRPGLRIFAIFGMAACWTLFRAHNALDFVDADLQGRAVRLVGQIHDLPENDPEYSRFTFAVSGASMEGRALDFSGLVVLSWYDPSFPVLPGQHLEADVRLTQPHSQLNPGGFDFERSSVLKRIRALGKVDALAKLSEGSGFNVNALRDRISAAIARIVKKPEGALLQGLIVADRRAISERQWLLLRTTGTAHLLAVSGLHIGLVAALGWWIGCGCWRLGGLSRNTLSRHQVGYVVSISLALIYAALAGFALPTQRALVMLVVFYLGMALRWRVDPVAALRTAVVMMLMVDPIAPLGASFWLSFGAAWALVGAFQGRLMRPNWVRSWLLAQGSLLLLASGLALLFFDQVPLAAPLANLMFVPWVSLFVLPCALLGALAEMALGHGEWFLNLSAVGVSLMMEVLAWLGHYLPAVTHTLPDATWWQLAAGLIGLALLTQPHPPVPRFLAAIFVLPMLVRTPPQLSISDFDVFLLDVGQGLSAVVRTRNRVMVYDTGRAYRTGGSSGERVLLPFLRSQRIGHIDWLVISHADSDHAGGLAALLEAVPVSTILTSATEKIRQIQLTQQGSGVRTPATGAAVNHCHRGDAWEDGGVSMRVWHPYPGLPYLGNDSSCVIRISSASGSLLLPGDISSKAELGLAGDPIASSVVVAPHHGSATSSSLGFIDNVAPQWTLFAAGYQNSFQFPRDVVKTRYLDMGSRLVNTFDSGMITLRFRRANGLSFVRYRDSHPRWWRKKPPDWSP